MPGAPIGDTLRQIGRLFAGGAVAGQTDAALLRRFVAAGDEEAFAGLVARHGPMVLAVCRGSLRDPADAEDAFQATFLVLVRRAGSLWVDESLGGWLYAVARRVARRANAEAMKREARERRGVEMDAFAGREEARRDRPEAALHEEIARLPEPMRRAIVLCELEGVTQAEAARVLHCGEATLRRRLAGARERLRARLAGQGVGPSALALLRPAIVPNGWAEATVRAAMASGRLATSAARLAAAVARSMALARRLRVAALAVVGLASAWGVVMAQQGQGEVAKPAGVLPAKVERPAPKWAHLTSDAGLEAWVRLEDGRDLWKAGEYAGLRDPASGTELQYNGQGEIDRHPDIVGVNEDGSRDVGFALDRAGVRPIDEAEMKRRMTPEGRHVEGGNFASDAQVVDLDGLRCLRVDKYRPDTLGKMRLHEQVWYDVATRRPVQSREILQLADQGKYKREYRTTTITYIDVDAGPADLFALGVPAGTPIVDSAARDKVVIPPELQKAFDGAARAIERLPRSCRIVEDDVYGLQLTYWSAPADYLPAWAAFVRDHGRRDTGIYDDGGPRSFFADHQGYDEPDDPRKPFGRRDDFPADRLAAWLPLGKSVNIHLSDGKRGYDLTRFYTEPGKPRRVQVHVHRDDSPHNLPKPLEAIWPFAFDNRRNLKVIPPEPGTPPGWVAIRVEYPTIRHLYYADPAHDYAVAQMIEWSDHDGGKMTFRTESKALRWKRLPGGTWYVSAWERRQHLDKLDASGKPAPAQPDSTSIRRVEITPMDPDRFPPGVFDGESFLESARKEGAKIEVD